MNQLKILLLVPLALMLSTATVCAHQLGQSYIFLSIYDDSIAGRFEITVSDLNKALDLDLRTDGSVTKEDLNPHIADIRSYVMDRVDITPDVDAGEISLTEHELLSIKLAQYVVLKFVLDNLTEAPVILDIDYAVLFDVDPDHRGLLVIENNWKTNTFNNEASVSLVFDPSNRSQLLDLSSSSVWRGLYGMIKLGVHHILVGLDHILFLIALLLPSVMRRRQWHWEPVAQFRTALIHMVKIVTVFTIAHTITLSLATLEIIILPSRLVESVIAISIMIAALDIIVPIFRERIWWIVFGFGLFHGFGFASVLSEMNIPSNYLLLTLLGFNLGVEIGQIAIVCVVFPLLFVLRNISYYPRFTLRFGAFCLASISLYWFIERAFNVDLPAGEIAQKLLKSIV